MRDPRRWFPLSSDGTKFAPHRTNSWVAPGRTPMYHSDCRGWGVHRPAPISETDETEIAVASAIFDRVTQAKPKKIPVFNLSGPWSAPLSTSFQLAWSHCCLRGSSLFRGRKTNVIVVIHLDGHTEPIPMRPNLVLPSQLDLGAANPLGSAQQN
jgi:hypothetical protein